MSIEQALGITLERSPHPSKGPDWIGSDGLTYDAVGNFSGKHFGTQWERLQEKIADHLGKADRVPVDVRQFSRDQIALIRAHIERYGDDVFIVGD